MTTQLICPTSEISCAILQGFGSLASLWPATSPTRKMQFRETIQAVRGVEGHDVKISLPFRRISAYHNRYPVPARGAARDRHERGAGCDGRDHVVRRAITIADGEGVWSWHPWAGAKPANDD
jgi:hypothetical protein